MMKITSSVVVVLLLSSMMALLAIPVFGKMVEITVPSSSASIESIIHKQKRFVLYNSRRLAGECLPVCQTRTPTDSPTMTRQFFEENAGVETGTPVRTKDPTKSPTDRTSANPTENPTANPTARPSASPTKNPTANPTKNPTKNPTANPTVGATVDPKGFCGQPEECKLTGVGQCQIIGKGGESSCGVGVPWGYYPDLSRCDAYCYCTGTEAPSRYEIIDTGLEWDTHQQGPNIKYLAGVYGKNGAWGTNGGAQGWPWQMSTLGRNRPGGDGVCGGPTCPSNNKNKTQPWNDCKSYYTCNNGNAGPIQNCGGGTLYDVSLGLCNHASLVENCPSN